MVEPLFKTIFTQTISSFNITFKLIIDDVGMLIKSNFQENSFKKSKARSSNQNDFDYGIYHTLNEINDWMKELKELYPEYTSLIDVSKSYENRVITMIKISVNSSKLNKKAIWMDSGIHAREWISTSTLIYITNEVKAIKIQFKLNFHPLI